MTATKNTPEKPAEANPFGPRVALERFAMRLVHEPSWGDGRLFGRSQKEGSPGRPGAPHEQERGRSCFRG